MKDQARLRLLRAEDYAAKPWKNGQGVTRDVLLAPVSDDFDVRVSLADIPPSSTFSAFPGICRHITRISGDALALTFADGHVEHLELMTPFTFDSGKTPYCEASGADTRVLNVMTRETVWRSSVEPMAEGRHRIAPPRDGLILLFAVAGTWTAEAGTLAARCRPGETLLATGPAAIGLAGTSGGRALLARLTPVAPDRAAISDIFDISELPAR
ncbi:MAG: HutD family protein [Parvibaculaceae bacterium]